ncbi:MAG: TonB-dependent receptor [Prevotellaceae bacterium]|nr:TonB-dependent receptor [Prevotellaceae bacterium]
MRAGIVKGSVSDSLTGERLFGAIILADNGVKAVSSDTLGQFNMTLPNGTHLLTVKYFGYNIISKQIKVGATPQTVDFKLSVDNKVLGEVKVKGKGRQNTETATVRQQQKAMVTMSGVSAQQIKRTQDKTAGEVLRRIPGVSIIDDKFVMVRGLSQRYNNVWLNGATAPSSEADQRAFSFDMVPSSQIDNMTIVKTASPEYPADFSGGFIMINTKEVPTTNSINVSLGAGFNTLTHFNKYLSTKGGNTDFLGFDNGFRSLNDGINTRLNPQLNGYSLTNNHLNNDWTVDRITPRPDMNLGFDITRRFKFTNGQTIGLIGSINYSNSLQTFDNMKNNLFGAYDLTNNRSNYLRKTIDQQYNNNVRLGAMLSLVYLSANNKHRVELKQIFNQTAKDRYTYRKGYDAQSDYMEQAEYYYQSRSTYNVVLAAKHNLSKLDNIDWNAGYAFANRNMPDRRRYTLYQQESGNLEVENLNDINREFSYLKEHTFSAAANWQHNFTEDKNKTTIKTGVFGEQRKRAYNTRLFTYAWPDGQLPQSLRAFDITTQLLTNDNQGEDKLYMLEQVDWSNNYKANSTIGAAYVTLQIPIIADKLEAAGGARYEHSATELISNTRRQEPSPTSTKYIYNDIFPSVNLTYHLNKTQQLRAAYGRTTNRPEFRELSTSVFYDFDLASNVQGNHNLKSAYIDNIDLGWEFYPRAGELICVSLFYKHFKNPIEWTYTVAGGTDLIYSYINAKAADNYGIELDLRKQLDFINLPQLSVAANASWINSKVKFSNDCKEQDRPMQGQSPYLINFGIFYNGDQNKSASDKNQNFFAKGFTANMLYNIIGKRIVGVGRNMGSGETEVKVPDSYEMPRHRIDLNVAKEFGRLQLKLSVRDLLSQKVEFKQFEKNTPNGEIEQITRSYRPGQSVMLSAAYKL